MSIGLEIGCHCLRPVVLSMQEHGLCHLLQFPDPTFGNSILVVGIDTAKAKTLIVEIHEVHRGNKWMGSSNFDD